MVYQQADLSDRLRRARREKGWTQLQLAEFCHVRTQTVSAWERGKRPQRRFFVKISDFLELPDEAAVGALLPGGSADADVPPIAKQDSPIQMLDLQTRVIEAVAHQVEKSNGPLRPDLVAFLDNLLASVGLPATSTPRKPEQGDR